jgi:DNA-binding LytR/AlgR family response regulator
VHILIAEGNATHARELVERLESFQIWPLPPVATAGEALTLYRLARPALVVISGELRGAMGGLALAHAIRAFEAQVAPSRAPGQPVSGCGRSAILFTSQLAGQTTFLRAFAVQPVAILVQPFNALTIARTVQLTLAQLLPPQPALSSPSSPLAATDEPAHSAAPSDYYFVREGGRLTRVDCASITCVQMEKKHCVIGISSGHHYALRATLGELMQRLGLGQFIRVHRSWLVNMLQIVYIDSTESLIYLAGGAVVPLGRSYRANLLQSLPMLD